MSSVIPYVALADLVSQHGVTVLLCGEGADELFLGYESYPKLLQQLVGTDSWMPALQDYAFPGSRRRLLSRLLGGDPLEWCDGSFQQEFRDLSSEKSAAGAIRGLEQRRRLEPLLYRTDGILMSRSIEARTPYLHGDVPTWAHSLTQADLITRTETKAALRAEWSSWLPQHASRKPKTPFRLPLAALMSSDLKHEVRAILQTQLPHLNAMGLRTEGIFDICDLGTRGNAEAAALLFSILNLALWIEQLPEHGDWSVDE